MLEWFEKSPMNSKCGKPRVGQHPPGVAAQNTGAPHCPSNRLSLRTFVVAFEQRVPPLTHNRAVTLIDRTAESLAYRLHYTTITILRI